MKTLKIIAGFVTVLLLTVNPVFAQTTSTSKYAKLVYMGKKFDLDQNFFIGYKAVYEANINKLCKKQKQMPEWDRINAEVVDFLKNPNHTVVYDENGAISFSPAPRLTGDSKDKSLNRQTRKDNEKASGIYGYILSTTLTEWVKKYK